MKANIEVKAWHRHATVTLSLIVNAETAVRLSVDDALELSSHLSGMAQYVVQWAKRQREGGPPVLHTRISGTCPAALPGDVTVDPAAVDTAPKIPHCHVCNPNLSTL